MNKTQAMAALRGLYGKKAAYRYDDSALKGEALEAAGAASTAAHEAKRVIAERVDARRRELLQDPVYLALRAELAAAEKAAGQASAVARHRRVSVGYFSGVAGLQFFHVTAEADNFQDAIDQAKAKKS